MPGNLTGLVQSILVAVIAGSLVHQYHLYQTRTLTPQPQSRRSISTKSKRNPNSTADSRVSVPGGSTSSLESGSEREGSTDVDSDEEDERAALNADVTAVKTSALEEMKLVLIINDSLKMTKGKIGAQCGHATLACYKTLVEYNPKVGGFFVLIMPVVPLVSRENHATS